MPTTGCRSAGWPIRPRSRWPTRGCWSRCGPWPTTTASPVCPIGSPTRSGWPRRWTRPTANGRLVAAFFIDLDHFSRINDTLGHESGDQLLQQVAARLRASCREREDEVGSAMDALDPEVARLGGDEFTVIMPGLADPEDAAKLARRILVEPGASVPDREPRDLRERQHRDRDLPVRREEPRDPPDACRHRDVQGEGAGRQQLPGLLALHERHRAATADPGELAAPGARAGGVRGPLPADRGRAERGAGGRRGAGPLAPSGSGPAAALGVHRPGGGERPHRAAGRMGDADRVRPEPAAGSAWASRRSGSW